MSIASNPPERAATRHFPYLVFVLILSVFALVIITLETTVPLDAETRSILETADVVVCVFLFDFIATLWRAPSKTRYLVTWGWIDFLSSIPMLDALRWGRAARMVRIFRVLRGVRAARILTLFILERRAQSVCLAASLVAIILLVVGSVAILQFEHHADSNIKSAEDAVWWSIVTLTTVGYGDRYPVTTEGRVVAAALMVAGVGLFGTLSGFIAAWFLTPEQQHQESEITELRREIRELREALKK